MDQESADQVVEMMHQYIDTESKFVTEEHTLLTKIEDLDYIFGHIDSSFPQENTEIHDLNGKIVDKMQAMKAFIRDNRLHNLRILKELQDRTEKLHKDVLHRDWRAAKDEIDKESKVIKEGLSLELHELKGLHSFFKDIKKLMSDVPKTKEGKTEMYYLYQVKVFVHAYEQILRHLHDKEVLLAKVI